MLDLRLLFGSLGINVVSICRRKLARSAIHECERDWGYTTASDSKDLLKRIRQVEIFRSYARYNDLQRDAETNLANMTDWGRGSGAQVARDGEPLQEPAVRTRS
jgi:hypothetical protein